MDDKQTRFKITADTIEAAFDKAQKKMPPATIIVSKKVLISPTRENIRVTEWDEKSARKYLKQKFGNSTKIEQLTLIKSGSKGFLGLGKNPNIYEANIFHLAIVEITYRKKDRILVPIDTEWKEISNSSTPKNGKAVNTYMEIVFKSNDLSYEQNESVEKALSRALKKNKLGVVDFINNMNKTWSIDVSVTNMPAALIAIRTVLIDLGCPSSTEIHQDEPEPVLYEWLPPEYSPDTNKTADEKLVISKIKNFTSLGKTKTVKKCAKCGKTLIKEGREGQRALIDAGDLVDAISIIGDILLEEGARCKSCGSVICVGCLKIGSVTICPKCGNEMEHYIW